PSKDWARNSAWLQRNALAVTLTAWLRHIALDGELTKAAPKKLRFRLFAAPARYLRHARWRILEDPTRLGLLTGPHRRLATPPSAAPRRNATSAAPTTRNPTGP
ncbi:MAG: transposase, partial [Actinomycetota bacterium]|nr:transposase [Actinomycetota bacterium]